MNKEILKRYFEGKSSRWERQQVEAYFKGEDMQAFDEYIQEEDLNAEDFSVKKLDKDAFFSQLVEKTKVSEGEIKTTRPKFAYLIKAAAIFLLLCSLGITIYLLHERYQSEALKPEFVTIKNDGTTLKHTFLSDGTKIWLNSGAKLSYDRKHFGDTSREVSISGEVFFDVAHLPQKPFKVHSGKLTTTVMGTAFNVEAYQKEGQIRVLLVRGYVRINVDNQQRALLPGQILAYSSKSKHIEIHPIDVAGKLDLFTNGKLVFESVGLADVLTRLENVFNIKISIEEKLTANKTVSGSYFRDEPEETLRRILFMHGLHLKKRGEKDYVITN